MAFIPTVFCAAISVFILLRPNGYIRAQEGTENITGGAAQVFTPEVLTVVNQSGIVVFIPPISKALVYPGPLPLPGVSWPILGGLGYQAEGRFPYNGYVGSRSPYIKIINRIPVPSSWTPVPPGLTLAPNIPPGPGLGR